MFNIFKHRPMVLEPLQVADDDIVAIADGYLFDLSTLHQEKLMGVGFRFSSDRVIICAPAHGVLSMLNPDGHTFAMTMLNGTELCVRIGVGTKQAQGFRLLEKKQGQRVRAGDPLVEVDVKLLRQRFDMSTTLIVTPSDGITYRFVNGTYVHRGESLIK